MHRVTQHQPNTITITNNRHAVMLSISCEDQQKSQTPPLDRRAAETSTTLGEPDDPRHLAHHVILAAHAAAVCLVHQEINAHAIMQPTH